MKFIDESVISVRSGNGGAGCVSFLREKFIPKGGPDGGDGGKGGDVILKATSRKRTLYHFRFKHHFEAKNGGGGKPKLMTGRGAEDIVLEVPVGTLVKDAETGDILKDFTQDEDTFVVVRGGRGGKGNAHFKTSTHRTPRFAQPGEEGQSLKIILELKLLADVGIIGLPNAGKSTLIAAMSSAKPKIADYPFTTLTPNLGVVNPPWGEPFVMADIPGLIEGAHDGAGLGTRFLRHIERTRILVHLIDASCLDPADPLAGYEMINRELSLYNDALSVKPQLVVLNKLDIPEASENADRFEAQFSGETLLRISAADKQGLDKLTSEIVRMLEQQSY